MIYKRGKNGIYSYRFRFAGRMIHESARTRSKTLAREAERQRRRELEERINNVRKRGLPPTFERAAHEWQANRAHRIAANTQSVARLALRHLLPVFGPKLLCDITPKDITDYQRIRLQSGAQGRTVNIEIATLRQVLKASDLWLPLAGKVRMLRERQDVAKALTPEQERTLVSATAEADSACHTATVLALNTAMRKGEIRLLPMSRYRYRRKSRACKMKLKADRRMRPTPSSSAASCASTNRSTRWAKSGLLMENRDDAQGHGRLEFSNRAAVLFAGTVAGTEHPRIGTARGARDGRAVHLLRLVMRRGGERTSGSVVPDQRGHVTSK